jgi:capsular polysaccharide biosynthesis protein
MDLWDVTKVALRRWYLAVPLLLVTVAGAGWVGVTVGPEYQATGHVAVIPPEVQRAWEVGQLTQVSPWNEEALAHAAQIRLEGKRLRDELAGAGYRGDWSVQVTGRMPVVSLEVVAPTAEQATATLRRLQQVIDEVVRERQAAYGITAQEQIRTVRYDDGESVDASASRQRRVIVAVLGAGLTMTVGLVLAFDALAGRRRSRREQRDGRSAAPTGPSRAHGTWPAGPAAAGPETPAGQPNGRQPDDTSVRAGPA